MSAVLLDRLLRPGLAGCLLLACIASAAQQADPGSPGVVTRDDTPADRHTQRVERIEYEDAGSRVDEVRAAGQTRSISVQPKAAVPAYEVQPAELSRMHDGEAGPGRTGRRTWKILSF